MNFINFVFSFHLLVAVAAMLSLGVSYLVRKKILTINSAHELHLNYLLLVFIITLPFLIKLSPSEIEFEPLKKTYVAKSYADFDRIQYNSQLESEIIVSDEAQANTQLIWLKWITGTLLSLSLLYSLYSVLKELTAIKTILKNSYPIRKLGKVKIVCSDEITVPFSFKTLFNAWVVIPTETLKDKCNTQISVLHEIQHHRQGDTTWQYLQLVLRAMTSPNPFTELLFQKISELQELKVDSTLVDEGKVQARDYAKCLIEVASKNVNIQKPLVCATGLAFVSSKKLLSWRINQMFPKKQTTKYGFAMMATVLTVLMSSLALKVGNAIGSAGITLKEAQQLASETKSTFPIVINERVVNQLNRYIQTQQGRDFIQDSLKRMKEHQKLIESKIKEYGLPSELIAIPVIESGFRNLPQAPSGSKGAGLWQFIPWTAMAYGLRVWNGIDDRLDVPKETDAAMRLLKAEKIRFGRWPLSVLAYNAGDKIVTKGIFKTGSHNVWTLIENGFEGDKDYMAKLTAVILIMKHPHLID